MLTATMARELRDTIQKQSVRVELYKVMAEIAEKAINPDGRDFVYIIIGFADDRVNTLIEQLKVLGYGVEATIHKDEQYAALTIKF